MESGCFSATANFAAMMRAAHLYLDSDPKIFSDNLALPFAGLSGPADLRDALYTIERELMQRFPEKCIQRFFQWIRAGVTARARYAEDQLARAIEDGVLQYVILGAGLDSFAYRDRRQSEKARIFEVDDATTQQRKRLRLSELGINIPSQLTFVPLDFERVPLVQTLCARGYRREEPAFFSWLGVTWFLSEEAIFTTLHEIASVAPGSTVVFEYPVTESFLDEEEQAVFAMIQAIASARGEPIRTRFDPRLLMPRIKALGFSEIYDLPPEDINRTYFSQRTDGLCLPNIGRFIRASVGIRPQFVLYDVSDFPIVRIRGSALPPNYGKQWAAEMDALLKRSEPFTFIFLDSAEHQTTEDRKSQATWLKANKGRLAELCRGAVAVEPDRAKRLLKRTQAMLVSKAFGLRFSIVADRESAETRARQLFAGQAAPEDE